ncbi:hypothetical protein F4678DRAFT_464956 [Xylaria arbuscula]|nr:hypothetical protein F4678DRAFT_464956 [Xylaria arbuscula]
MAESLGHGHKKLFNLAETIIRRHVRSRLLATEMSHLPEGPRSTVLQKSQSDISSDARYARSGGGLLIIDEFNSSLDLETDKRMQNIILNEFEGYTILMIGHRLASIMEFDRVIVTEKGHLVKQGFHCCKILVALELYGPQATRRRGIEKSLTSQVGKRRPVP